MKKITQTIYTKNFPSYCAALSPDKNQIAIGHEKIYFYDLKRKTMVKTYDNIIGGEVIAIIYNPIGNQIVYSIKNRRLIFVLNMQIF